MKDELLKICSEDEIIMLALLPSKVFTFISSANNNVSVLESNSFVIFLLKFYNHYHGCFMTSAIEIFDAMHISDLEKRIEYFDKFPEKYFSAVYEIISKFPQEEKDKVLYLVKELAAGVSNASCEFYGLGARISASEKINLGNLYSCFNIKN